MTHRGSRNRANVAGCGTSRLAEIRQAAFLARTWTPMGEDNVWLAGRLFPVIQDEHETTLKMSM